MKKKLILTFIAGVFTGFVLLLLLGRAANSYMTNKSAANQNVVWFDEPRQEVKITAVKVFQVLSDGSALANTKSDDFSDLYLGMVVYLPTAESTAYYDDQIIEIPQGKRLMQVGTYRYTTQKEMQKVVPVVWIMD